LGEFCARMEPSEGVLAIAGSDECEADMFAAIVAATQGHVP
jgi:hypothetical protein